MDATAPAAHQGSPNLSVIADPTRAEIVRLIRDAPEGRALVGALAEQLGLRQPTVSHHMNALRSEGIVVREPEGRRVWYSLDPEQTDRIAALLGAPASPSAPADVDRIVDDLAARYRGIFSRETVAACVSESHRMLAERSDSPLLTSRTAAFAASRLEAQQQIEAAPESAGTAAPTVLFVCVENAGRSQIAAGILRHLAGDRVSVRTAGSAPASEVRSAVVTSLDEIGVTVGGEFPKPLTEDAVRAADVVVTMGCGDACPIFPGRRYLDWDIENPAGKSLAAVRSIRDDIDERVRALLSELDPALASG